MAVAVTISCSSEVIEMSYKCNLVLLIAILATLMSSIAQAAPAERPATLVVEADLPVLETGKTQKIVIRALVRPTAVAQWTERAPLALAIVLDKSGSMQGNKIIHARAGAIEALERLDARDVATVIVYDHEPRVLVPVRSTRDKSGFVNAIKRINAGGSTALYGGTELGAKQLDSLVSEGYVPRIIMLSDGMANIGPSTTEELAALSRRLAKREMTITTIGLGLDYNEDLMTALAAESGGNSYFAKSANALPEIFARDMEDAVTLTARHVKLTMTCNDQFVPIRVIGRDMSESPVSRIPQAIEAPIDNLYGAEKYALFEVQVPASITDSELAAASVKLEYTDALTGKTYTEETSLKLNFTRNAKEVDRNRNTEIFAQTEMARNAEVRDEVVRLADQGRAQEASDKLRKRSDELKISASMAPSAAPQMQQEAEDFSELAESIEAQGSMSNEQRKENVNRSYTEKNQQSK